jgi:hypothetical protein
MSFAATAAALTQKEFAAFGRQLTPQERKQDMFYPSWDTTPVGLLRGGSSAGR